MKGTLLCSECLFCMSHFLSVDQVSKAYPGERLGAVNALSFAMEEGEIQSFVGKSGSGKSTLLRMLAGLLKPDEGSIHFQGVQLEDPGEKLIAGHPAIKMVFQDFELMPNMTVAENLKYPLLTYDKDFQKERVAELLTLCGISNFAQKLPRELSGGQQQRVALARALADEPALLLMDEPFSQLDPVNKSNLLRDVLAILKSEGVALVMVTHDTRDALMISDRIGFWEEGYLLQNDRPAVIYNQPSNRTIAGFFGHVNELTIDALQKQVPDVTHLEIPADAVSAGIRAEDVRLFSAEGVPTLEVKVEEVLYLGHYYQVRCSWEGMSSFVFQNRMEIPVNQLVKVTFPLDRLIFFSD